LLYFALQQDIDLKRLPQWFSEHHISHWIYVGDDSTWRVQAELSVPRQIQRISLAIELDKKSWELREEYLTLIGKLSNVNNTPEWWASELASKNPYTQLYTRICLLAASRQYIEKPSDKSIVFISSTQALNQELIAFAEEKSQEYKTIRILGAGTLGLSCFNSVKNSLETLMRRAPPFMTVGKFFKTYQKLIDSRKDYRSLILKQKNISDISQFRNDKAILFFTWVDHRNFTSEGNYRDPHFGPLPEELKKRGYEVIFVPRILFTIPYGEAVNRLLKTGEQFIFPEQCITSNDVFTCEQRAKQFQPYFPMDLRIGSLPVLSLIKEQYENYRKNLSDNLLYENLIKHLAERGLHPRQIIHTCEGHSWEQILKWSVQHYLPETKVIGFDNITFSRLVLSMFPAENELLIRPIPDRIVTNGPMFYEVLKNEGLPLDRIRSGCALRHTYLWESPESSLIDKKNKTGPIQILAATSIGLGDSVELAVKAAQAFGGDNSFEVLIKCHPMVDINQVKSFLGSQIHHKNIHFVTEPMDILLPRVDVLLYTYTSICFEALRFGVFPICIRSENFLNLDPLDAAPDIRGIATTPEEIRGEVERFSQMTDDEKRAFKERSPTVLKLALAPVTDSCINSFIV
jgi:surface carbohydrate biosynthesis protein (TIGR04326 family)